MPAQLPVFHSGEFRGLRVSRALHRIFAVCFPEAAALFERLQERAVIPFTWSRREDEAELEALIPAFEAIAGQLPAAGRAHLMPVLDWLAEGRQAAVLAHYGELGTEIGAHIRTVKQWNEEAAVIFEDNKKLTEECERLGAEYARQQEFLKQQSDMQAKVWAELKWTGDSWKQQRQIIDNLTKEKEALQAELKTLREQTGQGDAAG